MWVEPEEPMIRERLLAVLVAKVWDWLVKPFKDWMPLVIPKEEVADQVGRLLFIIKIWPVVPVAKVAKAPRPKLERAEDELPTSAKLLEATRK